MTARIPDTNGWFEVKDNPISRVGIFDYLGASIGRADPNRVYRVYRPADELAHPDCVDSFRLLPWTNEHAMLGDEDEGMTPAERKGVHGVIGEQVRFDEARQMLLANIKVWSQSLAAAIEAGKDKLSAGYRCVYDWTPGTWNGQPYDCAQRKIRGNHLALVDEGRMGPEVAVLDHKFTITFDEKDIIPMAEETPETEVKDEGEAPEMTLSQLTALVGQIAPQVAKLTELMGKLGQPAATEPVKDEEEAAADPVTTDEEEAPAATMDAAIKTLQKDMAGLKGLTIKSLMAEIGQRDALAGKISQYVGTFDHADKTLSEVAAYGAQKLGLKVAKGHELAALDGYFAARPNPTAVVVTMDGAIAAPGAVPEFLKKHGVK